METKRYAMIKSNVVYNVVLWDGDVGKWQPLNDSTIMVANDWVGIGDWYEESEQRFYRALPSNEDVTTTEELTA